MVAVDRSFQRGRSRTARSGSREYPYSYPHPDEDTYFHPNADTNSVGNRAANADTDRVTVAHRDADTNGNAYCDAVADPDALFGSRTRLLLALLEPGVRCVRRANDILSDHHRQR
jgi:hypothetical protein